MKQMLKLLGFLNISNFENSRNIFQRCCLLAYFMLKYILRPRNAAVFDMLSVRNGNLRDNAEAVGCISSAVVCVCDVVLTTSYACYTITLPII